MALPSLSLLDPAERARRVKAWAAGMGFDLAGIARAERLDKEGMFLRLWLEEGHHAEMTWMADRPGRRVDPGLVLADCRSVVVVGLNYHRPEAVGAVGRKGMEEEAAGSGEGVGGAKRAPPASEEKAGGLEFSDGEGRIAQYAQRVDYHRTMGKAVRRLARRIAAESGGPAAAKPYVDTGPVLEKAWARRAGLGFVGKNTCLIDPKRGSWFLLGVVLTTLEMEPDAPVAEGCGACRRCLDACPTGALVEAGVLDARRCLSYLTIEHRGQTFPGDAPVEFDGWVFGCDVCQEVCPYNRKHQSGSAEDGVLGPYVHPPSIRLSEVLSMGEEGEFLERFGRASPLRRAGLAGLKRNAGRAK